MRPSFVSWIAATLVASGCSDAPVDTLPAPPSVPSEDCAAGGWCWVRGAPVEVHGTVSTGAVFATGARGYFLYWSDGAWESVPVPTEGHVFSGWVASRDDMWSITTEGQAWHHDGTRWTQVASDDPLRRIMSAGDTRWAVSEYGLQRLEGGVFKRAVARHPFCLEYADYVVTNDQEIWTAGLACDTENRVIGFEVYRLQGDTWVQVGQPLLMENWFPSFEWYRGDTLRVRGRSPYEWNGSTWTAVSRPKAPQNLTFYDQALWDGFQFTQMPRHLGCKKIYRQDADNVWCWGEGQVHRFEQDRWVPTIDDPFATTASARRWGKLPPTLWAGGDANFAWGSGPDHAYRARLSTKWQLESFDGTIWTTMNHQIRDIHGASADDVWFATTDGPLHYDGAAFTPIEVPASISDRRVLDVHALGDGDALVMTQHELLMYRDESWSVLHTVSTTTALTSVAATSADDIWLARAPISRSVNVTLSHFDGTRWTDQPEPDSAREFGFLTSAGPDIWLFSDEGIGEMNSNDLPFELPPMHRGASLWVGPDGLWLTSPLTAQKYPFAQPSN